jgi:peptide/nickel transport system ATP-binding protein/oligopeptide transport system ATP-binding protein
VDSLLHIDGLCVDFATARGWARVVSDVSLAVPRGRTVGLVGESGSGKSVTCQSILRLIPEPPGRISGGRILFEGRDLLAMTERQIREVRGAEIAMIFQEPMTSLNPAFTIGNQIGEVLRRHRGADRKAARRRAVEVLDLVGIPKAAERVDQYPHEFSGGMRQRAMIAMALAAEPKLLIADEPTTALDVTIQAQVLDLIRELAADLHMGVLFVTHDLGVVADLCDEVVVMYAGQVVESATTRALFAEPRHPYTEALLRARPSVESTAELQVIPGMPPLPSELPTGCRFGARCAYHEDGCDVPVPLAALEGARTSRCVRTERLSLQGSR